MESYRHVEHACFVYFEKSQKNGGTRAKNVDFFAILRSSLIFQSIFTCNMAMESYWHVDYTSFVHFQISSKMKAVEAKEENVKSFFCSRAFIFWDFSKRTNLA